MATNTRLHRQIRRSIKRRGVAVTFTEVTPGRTDPVTGEEITSATETTIKGHAVRIDGDPDQYTRLGLVPMNAPTLLFTPNTPGDKPPVGSTVEWEDDTFTVKEADPRGLNGVGIMYRVVVTN